MHQMAYVLLDKTPANRFTAFTKGLEAAGYLVSIKPPRRIRPNDVMVLWNRGGSNEVLADCFEREGGIAVIAENGYIGRDSSNRQYLAIAKHGHNGSGLWNIGEGSRWSRLNIPFKPWRKFSQGHHILVCPNRFIGSKEMRMPRDWVQTTVARLLELTNRPVVIRQHPGNWQVNPPKVPIEKDLEKAYCTVIWSSTAGVHSLVNGVPVVYCAPKWICSGAAHHSLNEPIMAVEDEDKRQQAFEDLAWAQWSLDEIYSGEAFKCLLT